MHDAQTVTIRGTTFSIFDDPDSPKDAPVLRVGVRGSQVPPGTYETASVLEGLLSYPHETCLHKDPMHAAAWARGRAAQVRPA